MHAPICVGVFLPPFSAAAQQFASCLMTPWQLPRNKAEVNWEFHLSRGSKAERSSVLLIDAAWLVEEGKWKETSSTFLSLAFRAVEQKSLRLSTCTYSALHPLGWIRETQNPWHKQSGRSIPPLPWNAMLQPCPFFSASCHFKESLGKASHTNCFNLLSPLRPRTEATSILAKQDRTPCRASLCTC